MMINQDTIWSAQWIWLGADEASDVMLARKGFSLEELPQRAACAITASSQYKLYVNGQFVSIGPARCAPHHQAYDIFDVGEYLVAGENVIAVEVHHQRENVSYHHKSRGGLLCQIDFGDNAEQIVSDQTWKVSPDPTWYNDTPHVSYAHMEVVDRRDLRRSIGDWKAVGFGDGQWANARVLNRDIGWPLPQDNDKPGHRVPPWIDLVPRDLPYLRFEQVPIREYLEEGDLAGTTDAVDWLKLPVIEEIAVDRSTDQASLALPKALSVSNDASMPYLVFDLQDVHNAYTYLDIEGSEGTVIDILSVPFLLDGKMLSPLLGSHYVDRIVLSGDKNLWEAQYWKPMRYLALIVRCVGDGGGQVTVHDIGVRKKSYPFGQKGRFFTSDFPELEQLYTASAKTIQTATTDAYTDNYRERRQYAQTAYYACLGNYHLFGDTALQKRYLTQIAQEQLANGLMPAYAPRHGDDYMVILDSNCFWLRGLYQYLIYSGDQKTVVELLPSAQKLIALFQSFCNEDGLIDSPPYPYWLDHALLDRRGANLCLNAHFLAGLEEFVQILKLLNLDGVADVGLLEEWAKQIRQTIQQDFWNDHEGLFVDAVVQGEQSTIFSEHTQAMVLALGIATDAQQNQILKKLLVADDKNLIQRESGMTVVTPAMSCFLHSGLCNAGEMDASLDLLWRRFQHMLVPEHNGTLWEEWWLDGSGRRGKFNYIQGRSDAQTESAFPPWLFFRYVLGIEPVGVGLQEIVLHYHDSTRLLERKGTMPTPQGELAVEWHISQEAYKLNVSIPTNTVMRINLNSLADAVFDQATNNGVIFSNTDFLSLEVGQHQIEIPRKM